MDGYCISYTGSLQQSLPILLASFLAYRLHSGGPTASSHAVPETQNGLATIPDLVLL